MNGTNTSPQFVSDPVAVWDIGPAAMTLVKEAYLHYLWRTGQLPIDGLSTTTGQKLVIHHRGQYNLHDGPDFLMAKLEIDGVTWHGHVEMHVRASDWYRHHHHVDPAYDQVVLHVVWVDDRVVMDKSGVALPVLDLQQYVDTSFLEAIQGFMQTKGGLPCQSRLADIPAFHRIDWMTSLAVERLDQRGRQLLVRLDALSGDWAQLSYEMLARALGYGTNADTMHELAARVPWRLTQKVRGAQAGSLPLLLGDAGWLPEDPDHEVVRQWRRDYAFFCRKFGRRPIRELDWKTKGVRPHNQPYVRVAQLAAIVDALPSLMDIWISTDDIHALMTSFKVKRHPYLSSNSLHGRATKRDYYRLSVSTQRHLILNAVIPIIYAYGLYMKHDMRCQRALDLLAQLPPEKNRITRPFTQAGWKLQSALETQGLLQAHRHYCQPKKCLDCRIGCHILKKK